MKAIKVNGLKRTLSKLANVNKDKLKFSNFFQKVLFFT